MSNASDDIFDALNARLSGGNDLETFHICPFCGATTFIVEAKVTQNWTVDADGNYISGSDTYTDTIHTPDDNDYWECDGCTTSEQGKVFLIKRYFDYLEQLKASGVDVSPTGADYLAYRLVRMFPELRESEFPDTSENIIKIWSQVRTRDGN